MKIYFEKKIKENPETIIRRSGYAKIFDWRSSQTSYVRQRSNNFYPRFHMYAEENQDQLILNIHLDQKKVSYHQQTAHSVDYSGEIIEHEAKRIKEFFKGYQSNQFNSRI